MAHGPLYGLTLRDNTQRCNYFPVEELEATQTAVLQYKMGSF